MAGNTLNRGYPYPTGTDANDVPFRMQALAEAVDTDVKAVVDSVKGTLGDTAWTTVATFGTNYSGYATAPYTGVWVRRFNGIVFLTGAVSRTGTVVTAETVLTLPIGFRPGQVTEVTSSSHSLSLRTTGALVVGIVSGTAVFSFSASFIAEA